ncbi:DnaJ domain-containing protein [Sphingomonas japonica]|uniref:DnaJ-domain-containing protein 1 n=1 Tax=Sphingomonas japonica TaxID=511662 RepID=A0ABX0U2S5_9SPHN|nr:DnaJ domain-containing protein [Sphingomonas japonica]NIJ23028.1 DnaJ-domain-containing protein 1 [Sphingomonas japonica]
MSKLLVAVAIFAAVIWLWKSAKATRSARRTAPTPRIGLDEREARAILGVAPDADADAIRAAHRRLVGALHPDKGGSAELTSRINAARDRLLKAPPR